MAFSEMAAAIRQNDGQTALTRGAQVSSFRFPNILFTLGRAHLLVKDFSSAEREFQLTLRLGRNQSNFRILALHFPAIEILAHYYLGQLYESTGKRDQAINEYQEFLSHFAGSHTRLPQVADGRARLKQLMQ